MSYIWHGLTLIASAASWYSIIILYIKLFFCVSPTKHTARVNKYKWVHICTVRGSVSSLLTLTLTSVDIYIIVQTDGRATDSYLQISDRGVAILLAELRFIHRIPLHWGYFCYCLFFFLTGWTMATPLAISALLSNPSSSNILIKTFWCIKLFLKFFQGSPGIRFMQLPSDLYPLQ